MTQTIKNRLLKDIELVKTLDLPVMSASAYYKTLLLTLGQFCLVFLFCEFCMSLAYCLMGIHRWGKAEGIDYLYYLLRETLVFGLPISLFLDFLVLPGLISKKIIFEHYYRKHLQSGEFIHRRIQIFQMLLMNFFLMVSFIVGATLGSFVPGNLAAFIANLFFCPIVISLEIDRIAIPNLPAMLIGAF